MKTTLRLTLIFQLMTLFVPESVQRAFNQPFSIKEKSAYRYHDIEFLDKAIAAYELKIRLLDFSVLLEDNTTLLGWSIIPTDIIDRFEIERSLDNIRFIKIATLEKNLALNEAHHFKINDDISDLRSGLIYYRLKIAGINGQLKYSEVRTVRKNGKKVILHVFPDPVKDEVIIEIRTDHEGKGIIRIIDNWGTIVSNQVQKFKQGINKIKLNGLSRYSNGVYNFQCLVEADVELKKVNIIYK